MREKSEPNRKKFKTRVLGEELPVVGDISREYVENLAAYINEIGDDIARAYPTLPRRRLFGLTLLNIADQYQKQKEKRQDLEERCEDLEQDKKELQREVERLREENEELLDLLQEVE